MSADLRTYSSAISDEIAKILSWWSAAIMYTLATIEYFYGLTNTMTVTISGASFIVANRLFVQNRSPYWGRVIYMISANMVIFLATDASGFQPGWHFYFAPAIALGFVLFELTYRKTIAFTFLLPQALFLFVFFNPQGTLVPADPVALPNWIAAASFLQASILVTFFLGFFVFRVHRASREIEDQRQVAVTSSRLAALGEMAGGIAHEINNPLAVINGYLAQIERAAQDEPATLKRLEKPIARIAQMVERISKIVNGLRAFARDGKTDPLLPMTTEQLLEDCTTLSEMKFKSHGVQLIVENHAPGAIFLGQRIPLSQVLINLLNNSYDAIGSLEEKWVKVTIRHLNNQVEIRVQDSGKGIPPEIQSKIMQPFFTTKAIGRGTGLGLSISKGIIDQHKGEFFYDKGNPNTTFVLRLPAQESMIQLKVA